MKAKTTNTKPPVEGAARCYQLAPADSEDAFAFAAAALARRGWTPVEEDYRIKVQPNNVHSAKPLWVMVELWAIPPAASEAQASA